MSQLDVVMYFPLFLFVWGSCNILVSLVCMFLFRITYDILRVRSLFIQDLGFFVFEGASTIHLLKKLFSLKLLTYRANEYYKYLSKKIK